MKKYKNISPVVVADAFDNFLAINGSFRKANNLTKKIKNVHEILTGMTDKHGRICRYIKHQERKDPKSDWPDGMSQAMTGYIIYMVMLLEHYKVDITKGIIAELNEAIKQYQTKG